MLRKVINRAECEVEIDWFLEGSVLRGTVNSGAKACRTALHIDSPEPQEVIERIVRLAKQGCFAEQMVQAAVPVASTYILNGTECQIEYLQKLKCQGLVPLAAGVALTAPGALIPEPG